MVFFKMQNKEVLCVFSNISNMVQKSESFRPHSQDQCLSETLAVNPVYRWHMPANTAGKGQASQGVFCSSTGSVLQILAWSPYLGAFFSFEGRIYLFGDGLKSAISMPLEDFRSYISPFVSLLESCLNLWLLEFSMVENALRTDAYK